MTPLLTHAMVECMTNAHVIPLPTCSCITPSLTSILVLLAYVALNDYALSKALSNWGL